MIDEARGRALPLPLHLDTVCLQIAEDAQALGCEAEVERAREIVSGGTSADRQMALVAVVDWIAATTAAVPPAR